MPVYTAQVVTQHGSSPLRGCMVDLREPPIATWTEEAAARAALQVMRDVPRIQLLADGSVIDEWTPEKPRRVRASRRRKTHGR